jgi:CheY-like chemotaxis protein/predicted RNA-binding Zn-ribbon protein involved in translation (DUF1610 family)
MLDRSGDEKMPAGVASEEKAAYQYCPACGEDVLTYAVRAEREVELRCAYCGLPLSRTTDAEQPPMECVMLADDEKLLRWLVRDLLIDQHMAQTVIPCESGAELLEKFTHRLRQDEGSDLVILDILMKDLDGVAAAKAMRAVERGFGVRRPAPILFLSCLRPDTSLRNFVARVQPALFLNKSVDATPDRLGLRLRKMAEFFNRAREVGNGAALRSGAA